MKNLLSHLIHLTFITEFEIFFYIYYIVPFERKNIYNMFDTEYNNNYVSYNISNNYNSFCNKEEERMEEYNNKLNIICYYYIGCVNFLLLLAFLYDLRKNYCFYFGNNEMPRVLSSPKYLSAAFSIEMVDIEDYEKAMDNVVKKLKKDPMFYSNLIANAKETKGKRADVPTEVKDKKLNKVSDKMKDKANEMEVSKKDATKKNANDSLNKKEKMSGKPKGVKEMTMTPKKSKGMKSMDVPGKEKKTTLKESFNLWDSFKKNILR